MRTIIKYLCIVCALLANSVVAQTIHMRMPDTTYVVGTTVDLPVYADSSLTGKGIISYQLKFNYSSATASVTGIITAGTITSGFSAPLFQINTTTNTVTVSSAGTSPLSGSGVLFYIRMQLNQVNGFYFSFSGVSTCFFNQGSPVMTFKDAYVNITNPPSITAYFASNNPLTIGDSLQVYVSGGTSPYTFQSLNSAVATINSSGMLYALSAGKAKVRVQSANSIVDTTNEIEVRALRLSLPDTTVLPVSSIIYPLRINHATAANVISGTFRLNFQQGYVLPDSILRGNTLLQNATVSYHVFSNYMLVSFALSTPLVGAGDLMHLRLRILNPTSTGIYLQNVVFNQSLPVNTRDGNISFISLTALNITPGYGDFFSGETQQFSATGGRPPYYFTVTDTTRASITTNGFFTAKRGGIVKAEVTDSLGTKVQTSNLSVYDGALNLPAISALPGSFINYPVFLSNLNGSRPLNSLQLTITFNSNVLDSVDVIINNTLSSGWTFSKNVLSDRVIIAFAGAGPVNANGVLFRLRAKVLSAVSTGTTIYFTATNVLFNEGNFYGKISNGSISVVSVLQKDIGVNTIPNLSSSCSKSNQETISASIYNYANVTYFLGDSLIVGYQLNNNPVVMDTVVLNSNFSQGLTYIYDFKQKLNLSLPGSYLLKVFTQLPGDLSASNDTSFISFQVYGSPAIYLGNDTAICRGSTLLLDATYPSASYLWSDASTSSTLTVDSSGVYWVKVTASNSCEAFDTIQVSVNNRPVSLNLSGQSYSGVCGVDSLLLSVTPVSGNRYRWRFNGTNTANTTDTFNSYMVKISGIYNVLVTNSFGCSELMFDSVVTLATARQTPPAISGSTAVCPGDTIKLFASNMSNVTYVWNGPGGFKVTTQNIERPGATGSMSGTYSLFVVRSNPSSTCDSSVSVTTSVAVNPLPSPQSLSVLGSLTFCAGDSVRLSINAGTGNRYRWFRNSSPTLNAGDTLDHLTAKLPGTYNVSVTNNSGCTGAMRDTTVNVNTKPFTGLIFGDSLVTINEVQNYSVLNTSGSVYKWFITNGTQVNGGTTSTISVQWGGVPAIGFVKVVETNSSGCTGDSVMKPIAIAPFNDTLILITDTIRFTSAGGVDTTWIFSNRTWTINGIPSWLNVVPASDSGNKKITFTTQLNAGALRVVTLTITAGTFSRNLVIAQDAFVGVDELNQSRSILIFPNPSTGKVWLDNRENSDAIVFLYGIHGQLHDTFKLKKDNIKELDYTALPTGIYLIKIKTDSEIYNQRLLITR